MRLIDLTGKVFGTLTVKERDKRKWGDGSAKWFCQCECGEIESFSATQLRSGLRYECTKCWTAGSPLDQPFVWPKTGAKANPGDYARRKGWVK